MAERIREIINRIVTWWNKFSTRQKTFIIAAASGVILALAILITILSQPTYVVLLNCDSTKQASEVSDLLEGSALDYKVSDDGLQIKINQKNLSEANLLLGANDIQSLAYSIDNVTNGGFSTTESDKQKRYELYLESRLATDILANFTFVKSAVVDLYIPDNNGTLIAEDQPSSAWILLELEGDLPAESAEGIAKAVSVSLGNDSDENVVIMDTNGNTLFSGADNYSITGTSSSQLSVKTQWENKIKNDVKQVILGTNLFDKAEVAVNLNVDFSSSSTTDHEYYVADGNSQGYLSYERTYSSESQNGEGGVPGTDSNAETEYVYQDTAESSSAVTEEERKFLPSERITDKVTPAGAINYGNSSISLTLTDVEIVREEDVKAQGLLDGITWEEYKLANQGQTVVTIDDSLYDVVANATGFSKDNITIVGYSENAFMDQEGLNVSASDILQIVLILVILGLLVFVILRSMKTTKEAEEPEELEVETLLQSQPEDELEDIASEQVSETRRVVEKFVTDNPEAAANLLRNWLGDDWG